MEAILFPHFLHIDSAIGVGLIALDLLALGLLVCLLTNRTPVFITNNAVVFALALSFVATLGTLYYSEVVGVVPCKLCWYQRALMYPQILVFAYGLWKRDARAFILGIILSSLGLVIALYHISLPLWTSSLFCDPGTELCLIQTIKIFGFITIPMMSASMFFAILMLSIVGFRTHKESTRASNSSIIA